MNVSYPPGVLQPFTGFMTFVMIFTNMRFYSLHSKVHRCVAAAMEM